MGRGRPGGLPVGLGPACFADRRQRGLPSDLRRVVRVRLRRARGSGKQQRARPHGRAGAVAGLAVHEPGQAPSGLIQQIMRRQVVDDDQIHWCAVRPCAGERIDIRRGRHRVPGGFQRAFHRGSQRRIAGHEKNVHCASCLCSYSPLYPVAVCSGDRSSQYGAPGAEEDTRPGPGRPSPRFPCFPFLRFSSPS